MTTGDGGYYNRHPLLRDYEVTQMFEFMTNTVIMTQFLFIIMLDCYMAGKAIIWIARRLHRNKK